MTRHAPTLALLLILIPLAASAAPSASEARRALRGMAPECGLQQNRAACKVAEEMLAQPAPYATELFIDAMDRLSAKKDAALLKRAERRAGHVHFYGSGNALDLLGMIFEDAVRSDVANREASASFAKVETARALFRRVLDQIYQVSGDPYSLEMRERLAGYSVDSTLWLSRFAFAHDGAREKLGDAPSLEPAAPALAAVADAYRPKGKGPIPLRVKGRWKMVEAGDTLHIVRTDGTKKNGRVAAISTKGILLAGDDGEVVIFMDEIAEIR